MSERDPAGAQAQVLERIRADSRFVVATHENPDGDALGSLIAMHGLLTALGRESQMFIDSSDLPLPREYRCPALEHAIHSAPSDIAERTVVMLDCGNIDRNPAAVLQHGRHLLNIDHHHDNTNFGTVNLVDPDASCTAEIVWELMHGLNVAPTSAMAEALYIALVTDTGRFMYESTGPRAHQMAAELVGGGVDVARVNTRLYEDLPAAKLQLLGVALGRIQRFDRGALTLVALDAEDFERAGAEESFSEGVVDHLRAIEGTKVAVLVRELLGSENRGRRKVSLRATGEEVDVSAIARTQGGGGHRRAAGFSSTLPVPELIALLRVELAAQLDSPNGAALATLA
ncbi:MAG TPA: DHH family phosphoesterase [Solirubrobacteraceae bacterium]|jgi:phosphoesterase RecJ-like protein|nr:DHH family phosphoesterase [Solirubrobacteraceae bacterium]